MIFLAKVEYYSLVVKLKPSLLQNNGVIAITNVVLILYIFYIEC